MDKKSVIGIVVSGICTICITISALVKNDKIKNRIVTTVKDKNNIKKAVTFFSEGLSSFVRIFVKYKK